MNLEQQKALLAPGEGLFIVGVATFPATRTRNLDYGLIKTWQDNNFCTAEKGRRGELAYVSAQEMNKTLCPSHLRAHGDTPLSEYNFKLKLLPQLIKFEFLGARLHAVTLRTLSFHAGKDL